jgi:crotonobetainyl-CoA:carnitine CoA-transferase CaiB-like acyl-CoA transferase
VGLDIATPTGRELLYRLVETADVFVTNYLPDVRERLGIDLDRIRERNPRVIYVRGSGNGPQGPDANRGGFDSATYWSRAGIASALTEPEHRWPPSVRPGFGDLMGGLAIAGGVAAALLRRERSGLPSVVDVSLLSLGLWNLGPDIASAKMFEGIERPPFDRDAVANPLVGFYPTADGRFIALMLFQDQRYWPDLCAHLGRPELTDDPRFHTSAARFENRRECIALLRQIFGAATLDEWRDRLATLKGVWAPVQTPREVHDDPQVIANDYLQTLMTEHGASISLPTNPVRFDEAPPTVTRAPGHGEHTDEVLRELGLGQDEIMAGKIEGAFL